MSKVYIAGPVTGCDGYEENFRRATRKLERIGLEIVNPVALGTVNGAPYKYYIDRGLRLLMDCDAIVMLPDWEFSLGARLERSYAETVGMTVLEIKKGLED